METSRSPRSRQRKRPSVAGAGGLELDSSPRWMPVAARRSALTRRALTRTHQRAALAKARPGQRPGSGWGTRRPVRRRQGDAGPPALARWHCRCLQGRAPRGTRDWPQVAWAAEPHSSGPRATVLLWGLGRRLLRPAQRRRARKEVADAGGGDEKKKAKTPAESPVLPRPRRSPTPGPTASRRTTARAGRRASHGSARTGGQRARRSGRCTRSIWR
mmetsp:Transcript_93695/g.214326  ORF Transcript_93695/g.214326 Transcript_93695/m.214326 type:complete len:216 (+) Transcript_93695:796-1443(+)